MADFSQHEKDLIEKAESMKKVADKSCKDSDLETAYYNYRAVAYTMVEVFKTCPSTFKDEIEESVQLATGRMSEIKKEMAKNKNGGKSSSDDYDIKGHDKINDQINTILGRIKIARAAGQKFSDPSILLYGASGAGKTHVAEMISKKFGTPCLTIRCSTIRDKFIGESEKKLKNAFDTAANKKCSIFFDEVHALLGKSNSSGTSSSEVIVSEFLQEMNDRNKGILIIAATNKPWELDKTVLRRFGHRIHIPLPDKAARCKLIEDFISKTGMLSILKQKDIEYYSKAMSGYSPDDIRRVIEEAQGCGLDWLKSAQHFTIMKAGGKPFFIPCDEEDDGSRPMTWKTCPGKFKTVMCNPYMKKGMANVQKTDISQEDIVRLEKFGKGK